MKVVWVSHSGGPLGGAELSMCEAVKGLLGKGAEVYVVLPWRGELAARLEEMGINTHVKHFVKWVAPKGERGVRPRARRLAYNLSAARTLAGHVNSLGADVVVSNTLTFPVGAWTAAFARVPHVWYVHELFGRTGHDLYFDLGERISLACMRRLSDSIIVNSRATLSQLEGYIPAEKLRLIYCGVDVPAIESGEPEAHEELNLVHVGTMSSGKRQEDAVRALAILKERGLDVRLTLLGIELPEYGTRLRQLCRELGVEDRVRFVPFSSDPFSYIAAADCLVMCSRGESFGRVTVEAMKLGKPVVGAASGGTAELIRDGETGLLFPVGDANELARKLEMLYRDRALLTEMGRSARQWALANFSVEKYSTELLAVLRATVAAKADLVSRTSARTIS